MKHISNKLLAAAAVVLTGLLPQSVSAWTVSELSGMLGTMETLIGAANQNSLATNSRRVESGHIRSGQGEFLRIKYFMGYFDVDLRLDGDNAYFRDLNKYNTLTQQDSVPVFNGVEAKYLKIERIVRANIRYDQKQGTITKYYTDFDQMYSGGGYCWNYVPVSWLISNYNMTDSETRLDFSEAKDPVGVIGRDEYGNPYILFGPYVNAWNSSSFQVQYYDSKKNLIATELFDGYLLNYYNGIHYMQTSKDERSYQVEGIANNDALKQAGFDFGIYNFADGGMAYKNFNVHNPQYVGSTNGPGSEFDIIRGYFTGDGHELIIPEQRFRAEVTGKLSASSTGLSDISNVNYDIFGFDAETQQRRPDGAIHGRVVPNSLTHDDGSNNWHHALLGGARHTYINGGKFELDPWGESVNHVAITTWEDRIDGTYITFGNTLDVTFDIDITEVSMTHNPATDYDKTAGKYFLRTDVGVGGVKNPQYVEKVEIYAVPGFYTKCTDIDNVMSDAQYVTSFVMSELIGGSEGDITNAQGTRYGIHFFPVLDENGQLPDTYTFFARAIYRDNSTLTPGVKASTPVLSATHHSVRAVNHGITTGVDTMTVDDDMSLQTNGLTIRVNATETCAVEVYSISGAKVAAATTNADIELPCKGIYIVKAGKKVFKANI